MIQVQDIFRFYVTPAGRRQVALEAVAELAKQRGLEALAERASAAAAFDADVLERVRTYRAARLRVAANPSQAHVIDPDLDRQLSQIVAIAQAWVRSMPQEHPKARAASWILEEAFPQGVGAITQMPYVEQSGNVRTIVTLFASSAGKAAVQELGIQDMIANLEQLSETYRAEVAKLPGQLAITAAEVENANQQGQMNYVRVVAHVAAIWADDPELGNALFRPIAHQHNALARYYSARISVKDIDPKTGAELDLTAPTAT